MRRIRGHRQSDTEASVSDVIGSILLVGITVVMAGAFGAVLLSYDGPTNQQHTQLAVTVGPGADGDWGTNDAELRIAHLGGEDLGQGRVEVTYVDTAGTHTVSPTFAGGELKIGQSWTQVVSATPGVGVSVTVVVDLENGGGAVISSGSVTAGGSGATLTYVGTATAAVGQGTVNNIANAQSAVDSNAAATLVEGAAGGSPQTSTRAPASATNNGASNNNVLLSDDTRSILDSSGEWVQGAGFTAPAGFSVSALSIGMEARANLNPSTIGHTTTVTNTASSTTTISTASILGVANDVYLAAVANGASSPRTVSGISGPPGITWTLVGQTGNSVGNGRLEVWVGTGTPSLAGLVTATFSGTIDRAAIAVSRFSGVDNSNPLEATLTGEAGGTGSSTVSLGPVAGTATNGRFYTAINGANTGSFTFSTPTEEADVNNNGEVQLGVAHAAAAASNTVAATMSSSADWHGVALTLRPFTNPVPTAVLSYRLSTVAGATSLSQALTASDATYEQSIIGDRAWALADLANVDVRVTYPTDTGSNVEVDRVYLQLTYTTSATTYSLQVDLGFSAVPDLPTQVFQMRYKVVGDTFQLYAMTGAVERLCPGTLNSAIYAVVTCAITTGEYNAGAPVMRLKDSTPAGTAQGTLTVEYARVSSS